MKRMKEKFWWTLIWNHVWLATKRVKVHINNVFTIGSVINSHQAYVIDENFVLDKKRNIKKFLDINLRQKLVQLKSERIVFANILFPSKLKSKLCVS